MYSCRYKPNCIYSITPTVAPDVTEPVTLDEVKDWLNITFNDDDTKITALISQARSGVEMFCNISMVAKTLVMQADIYTDQELPYGPVAAITGVTYRNGTVYEAYIDYTLDGNLLCLAAAGRFRVTYTAGPMDMVSNASLKLDLLRIIAYLYEHRGDEALTSLQNGADRAKSLDEALELFASKYKVMSWL